MQDESSCDAACKRTVSWAEEFRASLDRHLRVPTRRLAADGRRYAWWEFARYYREHANAMWVAARERGNAVWLREHVRRIRWRIFACKLIRFARVLWRIRWRIFTDIRIGARRTDPWDEPAAPVMSETKAWIDYNEEYEDEPDAYNEDDSAA